jgi:hypothetical protein
MEEDLRSDREYTLKTPIKVEKRLELAIDQASKRIKYESAHDDSIIHALEIVAEFIKRKKRVCYGGTAMNAILPESKKFYNPEIELPDYDFYTPDVDNDVKELVDDLNKDGYKDVYHKVGIHEGTKKILVNFVAIADITFIEPELYNILLRRSIVKSEIHYTDENVLRMMMYLELSRPKGMVERWPKVFERLQLINHVFPIRGCNTLPKQKKNIPFVLRNTILKYIVEWKRILCNGPLIQLYRQGIRKRNAVFRIEGGGPILFTSPDPKVDALTLKGRLEDSSIKLFRHTARGDIVPERIELRLKKETLCVIVQETACHSCTTFPMPDGGKIFVGSLEFLITLYLSMSIFTTHADDILGQSILCQVKQFIELSNENNKANKSQFTPFPLQCRGHQTGFASLLRDKVRRTKLDKRDSTRSLRKSVGKKTRKDVSKK